WLRDGDRLLWSRAGAPEACLRLIDQFTEFLGELSVAGSCLLCGNLHRDGEEPSVISFRVALDEGPDLLCGRHCTPPPQVIRGSRRRDSTIYPQGAYSSLSPSPVPCRASILQ